MPKLTKRKLRALIREESATAKYYHKLGFHKLANDEESHAGFFKILLR